ncbi:MAG: hypothetical protein MZU95_00785 [Desulfomicrobium escambiense]|nr:hypothetical protein [Desulfomicrobium escambiense]
MCTTLFLVLLAGNAFSETFRLTTGDTYPRSTSDGKGYRDLIIKEMFRRVGHAVKSVHMPAERALVIVDEGIDDGTYTRIAGLEKQYPNLVMVPEKVPDFEFAAFGKKKPIQEFRDWGKPATLQRGDYHRLENPGKQYPGYAFPDQGAGRRSPCLSRLSMIGPRWLCSTESRDWP